MQRTDQTFDPQEQSKFFFFFSLRDGRRPFLIQKGRQDPTVLDIFCPKYPWQLPISNSHITLVGVDPVEQCLGCHPLNRQSALQTVRDIGGGPRQGNTGVRRARAGLDLGRSVHIQRIPPHCFSGKATCTGSQQRNPSGRKPARQSPGQRTCT